MKPRNLKVHKFFGGKSGEDYSVEMDEDGLSITDWMVNRSIGMNHNEFEELVSLWNKYYNEAEPWWVEYVERL